MSCVDWTALRDPCQKVGAKVLRVGGGELFRQRLLSRAAVHNSHAAHCLAAAASTRGARRSEVASENRQTCLRYFVFFVWGKSFKGSSSFVVVMVIVWRRLCGVCVPEIEGINQYIITKRPLHNFRLYFVIEFPHGPWGNSLMMPLLSASGNKQIQGAEEEGGH